VVGGDLALVPLADALIAAGADDRARSVLAQELARAPSADAFALLGLLDRRRGELAAAAGHYAKAVRLNPDAAEAAHLVVPLAVIPDFLPTDRIAELRRFVDGNRSGFSPTTIGARRAVRPEQRNNIELELPEVEAALQGWFLDRIRGSLPAVTARLNEAPFRFGAADIALRAYPDGTFFRVHRDRPTPQASDERAKRTRRITFTYFFHLEPQLFTGGDLLLYDSDPEADQYWQHRYTRVVPRPNTLVCFPSGYYHEVTTVQETSGDLLAGRLAVNGHLHQAEPAP
jgi:predicted 2-oxoglutarate/Fe(II)-dependent dioxygenase YbiX